MDKHIVRTQDGMEDLIFEGAMCIREQRTIGYVLLISERKVYYNLDLDVVKSVRDHLFKWFIETSDSYSFEPDQQTSPYLFLNIHALYPPNE